MTKIAMKKVRRTALSVAAVVAIGAAGNLLPGGAASAQDAALMKLGAQLWKEGAPCRGCHGSFANGLADIPQQSGPPLRGTTLTLDQVAEIIRCGRPGRGMPYFDRFSYTDGRCYGVTAADLGSEIPPKGSPDISPRQVNALAAFVIGSFAAKPQEVTLEECRAFWGEAASSCAAYDKNAKPGMPHDLGSH